MGFIQKDALRTMFLNYLGILIGYLNKGVLFLLVFSSEQYGLVNLLLGVGLLFAHFSNLGTINAIARFLPFFKENQHGRQGFLLFNLMIAIAGILLFTALAVLIQRPIIWFYSSKSPLFVNYFFWIIPLGIANILFLIFESYLKAIFKNVISVFVYEFLLRICISILLVLVWLGQMNFDTFLFWHSIVYFVPSLFLLLYLLYINELKFRKSAFKISKKFKRIIFSFSLLSYTNTIGILIVTTLDALMIAYYKGLSETGYYTTLAYFISAMMIPYRSLIRISSPLIAKFWKERKMNEMQALYVKFSSVSLVISLIIFLGAWGSRHFLINLLPSEFHQINTHYTFLFLMLGKLVDMYFGLNGFILIYSKKFVYDIYLTCFLIVGIFCLNYFLIPKMGMSGAALSTGILYFTSNLIRMLLVYKFYNLHFLEWNQLKVVTLAIVVCLLFELSPLLSQSDFVQALINGSFSLLLFLIPIHYFQLNKDLNDYLVNGSKWFTQKIGRK